MPDEYIDECTKIIRVDMGQKTPKIKYSTLIGILKEEGLRWQGIKYKLNSLKLKWIKKIYQMLNIMYPGKVT
jgi:hypothetical protein